MNFRQRTDELILWYTQLSPETLPRMSEFYCEKLYFKDPFHVIKTESDLQKYMGKAFTKLKNARFVFQHSLVENDNAVLIWDFEFRIAGRDFKIHGNSWIKWTADGKIEFHRDYWDLSEEVWEKIPGFGLLIKALKNLFS